jgi:hypothetical protein
MVNIELTVRKGGELLRGDLITLHRSACGARAYRHGIDSPRRLDFLQLAINDPAGALDRNPCKFGFGLTVECLITDLKPEAIKTGLIAF